MSANTLTSVADSFGEQTPSYSAVKQVIPAGVRVLVADDEPQVRRVVASALRRMGFEVRTVDDGAAAIALAEQTPFDLALVDLGMPTGGFEVVRRLKQLYGQAIHVEILSGNDDQQVRLEAFDAGTDGYLLKPISITELQKRVGAAARAQQAYIAARQAGEKADRLLAWGTEAAALLAHDLNNGLAIALSNMTYLSQTLQVADDDAQALGATVRALRRMAGLVANFVDVSRFEEDALRPRTGKVKLRELLLEVMSVHTPSMTRGIKHAVSCNQDIVGNFDEALIARVLHNLVGNATRYCNPGGMIRISANEVAVKNGEPARIELTVHNTGPHVPPALAAKLFGKYAQGKDGQRGLGLYFCRLACEAHGGTVRYEAAPDGPMFVLSLPTGQITPTG